MARTAVETANILNQLFEHNFGQDYAESFRITWPQLRSLAAVPRLSDFFLKSVNVALSEFGQALIPLNNYLLVAREHDLDHYRLVPDRLLEEYLPDGTECVTDAEDQELADDGD